MGNEVATHQFMGQVVSVHLLCASHEGSVDVALMVDGVERISFSNGCTTPAFTVEDASFTAGRHEVSRWSPAGERKAWSTCSRATSESLLRRDLPTHPWPAVERDDRVRDHVVVHLDERSRCWRTAHAGRRPR